MGRFWKLITSCTDDRDPTWKKKSNLLSPWGWNKWWDSLKALMKRCGWKWWLFHVREHLNIHRANANEILTARLLLRTVTEEPKARNRGSWVLPDRPTPTQLGRQAIWSNFWPPFPHLTMLGGGGWLPTKRGEGSQVQKISLILTVSCA